MRYHNPVWWAKLDHLHEMLTRTAAASAFMYNTMITLLEFSPL